jgi:aryl-alcohol dehydrogenase-like predicted oxidoreductase
MMTGMDMTYRQLGSSGLTVSVVGIGCNNFGWRIGADRVDEVVHEALDAGVTLFDTAAMYGQPNGASEELLGRALGSRRDEAVVATKFGAQGFSSLTTEERGPGGSRRHIRQALEQSLRRLGTDWIDLYQLHVPDPATPIEETLSTLDDLVREGKVRYVGCSNFAGWQVADADWTARGHGWAPFISAQNHYSLLERDVERELVPACLHFGLGVLPYFPLASGLLTGKYRRDTAPPEGARMADGRWARRLAEAPWDLIEALEAFAEKRGISLLDVAIGGLASRPAVASVIAGATSAEQVRANVAAGAWVPDAGDAAELEEILTGGTT